MEDKCTDRGPHDWDGLRDPQEGMACELCGITEAELEHLEGWA